MLWKESAVTRAATELGQKGVDFARRAQRRVLGVAHLVAYQLLHEVEDIDEALVADLHDQLERLPEARVLAEKYVVELALMQPQNPAPAQGHTREVAVSVREQLDFAEKGPGRVYAAGDAVEPAVVHFGDALQHHVEVLRRGSFEVNHLVWLPAAYLGGR